MTEKYVRYYHGCSGKKARIPHMYNFVWSEPLQMCVKTSLYILACLLTSRRLIALHDTTDLQAKTLNTDVKGEAVFMGIYVTFSEAFTITHVILQDQQYYGDLPKKYLKNSFLRRKLLV